MFNLGETREDIYYFKDVLEQEIGYSSLALNQDISEYEKERWQASVSQSSGMLADIGIPDLNYTQSQGVDFMTAGFDLGTNWPIMAILGIGMLVAMRKGKPNVPRRRMKKSKRR
jgi:hypothetical protein